MDFIQNEINYNLIILYIEDFIQYELELGKGFNMKLFNNFIENCKNNDNYLVKDLINHKGFVIFSKSNYKEEEKIKLFEKYGEEECLKEFYEKITNEPHSRYFYIEELEYNNENSSNKILTYLMLNPSYARENFSDKTMDRARKWAKQVINPIDHTHYKYFAVINIYSYRHHLPKELFKIVSSKEANIETNYLKESNLKFIQSYIKNEGLVSDFILAYGRNAKSEDIKKIISILNTGKNNFYTYFQNINGIPYHLLARASKVYYKNKKIKMHKIKLMDIEKSYFQIESNTPELDA